jgi:DNA-binding HxlR family transcriptional regulator
MATTADPTDPRSSGRDRRTDATTETLVRESDSAAPAALDLLDDEYAREVLFALTSGPRRGRDLVAACDASRSTVYRRVNSLEDAGLVTTETNVDPDGHHCKEFRLVRDRLTVTFRDGAIAVRVQRAADKREPAT